MTSLLADTKLNSIQQMCFLCWQIEKNLDIGKGLLLALLKLEHSTVAVRPISIVVKCT